MTVIAATRTEGGIVYVWSGFGWRGVVWKVIFISNPTAVKVDLCCGWIGVVTITETQTTFIPFQTRKNISWNLFTLTMEAKNKQYSPVIFVFNFLCFYVLIQIYFPSIFICNPSCLTFILGRNAKYSKSPVNTSQIY